MHKISDDDARTEIIEWKAIKVLLKDNRLACHIVIAGMSKGVCNNQKLISVVNHNIREIEKFLVGETNDYE